MASRQRRKRVAITRNRTLAEHKAVTETAGAGTIAAAVAEHKQLIGDWGSVGAEKCVVSASIGQSSQQQRQLHRFVPVSTAASAWRSQQRFSCLRGRSQRTSSQHPASVQGDRC
jgi:hypothetical protein